MTTKRTALRAACAVLVVALTFPVASESAEEKKKAFAADKGHDKIDTAAFPKAIQDAYEMFSTKCSKCHTLARPINTNMSAEAWKMYVKRMSNKPDSGISPDQAKLIYSFLKFYQAEKDIGRTAK